MSDLNSLLDQSSYLRLMSNISKHQERATSTKTMSNQKEYVSCIRIKGRPILPPVMTTERKLECIEWKRKALEVEEKLGIKRREKILATIKSLNVTTSSASTNMHSRPSSAPVTNENIENMNENSGMDYDTQNVDLSKDTNEYSNNKQYGKTTKEILSEIPGDTERDEIITNDGITTEELANCDKTQRGNHEPAIQVDNTLTNEIIKPCTNEEITEKEDAISESNSNSNPTFNRERRGSYTLEEPSPLLLAYMERFGQNFNEKSNFKCKL